MDANLSEYLSPSSVLRETVSTWSRAPAVTAVAVFTAWHFCLWSDMGLPVQVMLFVRSRGLREAGWTLSRLEDLCKLVAGAHNMVHARLFGIGMEMPFRAQDPRTKSICFVH